MSKVFKLKLPQNLGPQWYKMVFAMFPGDLNIFIPFACIQKDKTNKKSEISHTHLADNLSRMSYTKSSTLLSYFNLSSYVFIICEDNKKKF